MYNCTFLVCFSGISGEFCGAMIHILEMQWSQNYSIARQNNSDKLPKRNSKVQLVIYHTQIQPKILAIVQYQVSDLIS